MKVFLLFVWILTLCFVGWAAAARADFDVSPRWSGVSGDPMITWGFDDGPPGVLSATPMRVFLFAFDNPNDSSIPNHNTTTDPGTHAVSSEDVGLTPSELPDGSHISFDILSNLQYWNGSTFTTALPGNETLQLQIGTSSDTLAGTGPIPAGYQIGKVGPPSFGSEELHVHFASTLTGPGAVDPTDGVYGFLMQLKSDDPDIANSAPYFVLYDYGTPAGDDDAAVAYAETLVPEPSACVLAALGGALTLGGCRRGRRVQNRKV
jgi:hypothetical protein